MEYKNYIQSFFNFDDASSWLEKHLAEYKDTEYKVIEARIVYINHQWRAGLTVAKSQMELIF